ncbi:uncharacterized protein BCR38DRAFT_516246 [Pseudomassariella vexata]|uniref:Uncharacterized protein n=1 Tax=Pseudomassariella vexata TaxID=1141098 RepID=A0A1Y2DVR3_9PEZI|nr:uncharacterized protein BCR38DRAFT_516246 [Pseudomassariella vexata]ORY63204.1 hypothetical protein BCR38DRAFT_516246 [Pseudomassariella vexata]
MANTPDSYIVVLADTRSNFYNKFHVDKLRRAHQYPLPGQVRDTLNPRQSRPGGRRGGKRNTEQRKFYALAQRCSTFSPLRWCQGGAAEVLPSQSNHMPRELIASGYRDNNKSLMQSCLAHPGPAASRGLTRSKAALLIRATSWPERRPRLRIFCRVAYGNHSQMLAGSSEDFTS